jgi:hypothetical protein
MAKKQNIPQNDEVDLGNLFKIIGKGFKNLFNAIAWFLSWLFNLLVQLLIFFRNNLLKLGVSMIIGAVIGLFLDLNTPKPYYSNMVVEPNFKSTQQLYSHILFYHELVKQKETDQLASILSISPEEAKDLKGFYVEPIRNENEKYEFFISFIETKDTAIIKRIDLESFKKAFTDYDYRYHKITVKSNSNHIFEKLRDPIVSSIGNNAYFKNQKKINDENLLQNELVLKKSLLEVDSLRKIYNEVLLLEAKKAETGTSITLAEGAKKTAELELFSESLVLNKELIENNLERAETTEIINVVSDFTKSGSKEREWYKKYTFILGLGFGVLMLLMILLKHLNSYLRKYN